VSMSERWFVVTLVGNLSSHTFKYAFGSAKARLCGDLRPSRDVRDTMA
jgi:hypothetical protein